MQSTQGHRAFCAWLRLMREERKMTQEAASKAIGAKPSCFKTLEGRACVRLPSKERFEAIVKLFGAPPPNIQAWYEEASNASLFRCHENESNEISPFGREIRTLRRSKNLSADQLNALLGRGKQYIQRIENARRNVPLASLLPLAQALGFAEVPQHWIHLLEEGKQVSAPRSEIVSEKLPALGRELRKLRKEKQLTSHEVSRSLAWAKDDLCRIELGKVAVNDQVLLQLAQFFGFSDIPPKWIVLRRASRQEPQKALGEITHLSRFGRLLRARRKELHLSQKDVGKALGLRLEMVSEIEYGRTRITEKQLEAIAHVCQYTEVPQAWEKVLRESDGLHRYKGLGEEDLPTQGWEARKKRLEKGVSIRKTAELEGVAEHVIIKRERGPESNYKQRKDRSKN